MKVLTAKKIKKSDAVKDKDKYVTKIRIRLKDAIDSSNNVK